MISTEGSMEAVLQGTASWHVGHGDCRELLKALPDACLDAMVTDPPAGISFMGKDWDQAVRGGTPAVVAIRNVLNQTQYPEDRRSFERESFIAYLAECLREAFRVLKPGAHALVWALPRTSHWTGMAIELAGFEIIDKIDHLFSQGASKSKSAKRALAMQDCELPGRHYESSLPPEAERQENDHVCADHAPPTEWDGHGTGLAPAHENWWLIRKPLDGTVAENLQKWGTGVIDIDGTRIPVHAGTGRWPKNVVLSHAPGCKKLGTTIIAANPTWDTPNRDTAPSLFTGEKVSRVRHKSREGEPSAKRRYTGRGSASMAKTPGERRDDVEEVDVWECEAGCAVLALHAQGGNTKTGVVAPGTERGERNGVVYGEMPPMASVTARPADAGPVTRFYLQLPGAPLTPFVYQAKPTRTEKDAGLTHFRRHSAAKATGSKDGQTRLQNARTGAGRTGGAKNIQPTVKGKALMRYFVRLVCPPGGIVLDLFTGSGTTGVAAVEEGRRFIGCEINDSDAEPYVELARARITYADGAGELVPRESLRAPSNGGMLDGLKGPAPG